MIHIALYSRHPLLIAGFRAFLAATKDFTASVCGSPDLLADHAKAENARIILADMACGVTLDQLNELRAAAPGAAVILWVEDDVSAEFISQAISAGIPGVLSKRASIDEHLQCFGQVVKGELWIESDLSRKLAATRRVQLTPRERQLTALLAQGLKNKEAAHRLGIAESTVKVYLSRLYRKLGVNDRFDPELTALKNLDSDQARASENLNGAPEAGAPLSMPATTSLEQMPPCRVVIQ